MLWFVELNVVAFEAIFVVRVAPTRPTKDIPKEPTRLSTSRYMIHMHAARAPPSCQATDVDISATPN
jgi:hypothetical protein